MNLSSDENRITEIKARAEKATPGPWEVEKYYHDELCEEYIKTAAIVVNDGESAYTVTRNDWSNPVEADLNFIATARQDIPYLLVEIESLQLQLAESQRREHAAIRDLNEIGSCVMCKHNKWSCEREDNGHATCFEWRGTQE